MAVFKDEFVPNIQTANKTNYNQWKSSNPGEASKWEQFRDAVIAGKQVPPPSLSTKYGKALVAAGKLEMSVTDIGSDYNPPPPPPPPGTLYDQLSDFFIQPWGGTYIINIYQRVYPANGYQQLGSGSPWPATAQHASSFNGVVETTTPYGPGFYFRVYPEMTHGAPAEDNKSCLIPDDNHIIPNNTTQNAPFIGRTMDVTFKFMLPASGNPSFSNFNAWNCLYEYHPGGSYPVNNQLGVDPTTNTIYVRCHDGNNSDGATPAANYGRAALVLDHWYDYRRRDTWSRTNGTTDAWIDNVLVLHQTGVGNVQANAHGTEYATVQPNFGFYSGAAAAYPRNEVYYGDMRILVT